MLNGNAIGGNRLPNSQQILYWRFLRYKGARDSRINLRICAVYHLDSDGLMQYTIRTIMDKKRVIMFGGFMHQHDYGEALLHGVVFLKNDITCIEWKRITRDVVRKSSKDESHEGFGCAAYVFFRNRIKTPLLDSEPKCSLQLWPVMASIEC